MANNQDVILSSFKTFRAYVDGTLELKVVVEPSEAHKVVQMCQPGATIALAKINPDTAKGAAQEAFIADVPSYGKEANILRLSGFFKSREVLGAIGPDDDYLEWLKGQKCAAGADDPKTCNGDIVPAHVRRVANGAGAGIKPKYSAIPLCHNHHSIQHQEGESAIGGKMYIDRLLIQYLTNWAWDELKAILGVESMRECPPVDVFAWAQRNGVAGYLPEEYYTP